jgi:hypothetical protein
MWLAYYSREGRCEHNGGLGVAYVSQMIEVEACESGFLRNESLQKLGLGVRGLPWVWRFVARCC